MKNKHEFFYLLLFALAFVVNISALNVGFFSDDPGLYAAIAKNMINRHEFFSLFTYNYDWLDKPHFPFWMVFISFKLFGISTRAYRLPALVFFCVGLIYTYKFSNKFYSKNAAWMAVLIVMTSQHIIMSNTDVRAEPYLMAFIIGSIYHLSGLNERFSYKDLLMASLLTACAVMTKGIFVIVAIYGALAGQLLFNKSVKSIFQFKWLAVILLTILFTLPEFYALYLQFDLHPEKVVFGHHHVSGIKWFLWDSQFGRFANSGPITRKSGDVFFFVHTLLWAFAPWCLLFYFVLYKRTRAVFARKKLVEYYTISGGLLLLLLFSISRFQLPFYTNILIPLFAVIIAPLITVELEKTENAFRMASQWVYIIAFPLAILLINFFMKPASLLFAVDCVVFGLVILMISVQVNSMRLKTFFFACTVMLFVNFYLNTILYPEMTAYNGQMAAADYLNQKQFSNYKIHTFSTENNIFQFYCNAPISVMLLSEFKNSVSMPQQVFFAGKTTMNTLKKDPAVKVIKAFENYPKETFTLDFINQSNRHKVLDSVYLVTK